MKATGIVRKIDDLGRLVIPRELRRTLDWSVGDPMEVFVEGGNVVIKKYEPACIFCREASGVSKYKEKNICKKCMDELKG